VLRRIRLSTDAGSQYTSVRFGETLLLEGLIPSVGTVGDALDNALAETTIGLYKTECVRNESPFRTGPIATLADIEELASLAWVAIKVGALSYGGGFVIIPLMQADAVNNYHWMTSGQFLNAVALGQITPGPVVTVAVVGYAAAGLTGGILASAVAFSPSFAFILFGARHFDRLRGNPKVRGFLDGAGPAAIGAILGSAISLARALAELWQLAILAAATILLLALKRGVVTTLLASGAAGIVLVASGAAVPH
jgi:chromate transporter